MPQSPINAAPMKLVLVTPEIPWNTGAIGRTCVALNLELILIKPYGFSLSEKAIRRSGMDYWQHLKLTEYDDWTAFMEGEKPDREHLYFFENYGTETFYAPEYHLGGYLVFGCESKGLPRDLIDNMEARTFSLPMKNPAVRSLNLANTATAVIYQAMRTYL